MYLFVMTTILVSVHYSFWTKKADTYDYKKMS